MALRVPAQDTEQCFGKNLDLGGVMGIRGITSLDIDKEPTHA